MLLSPKHNTFLQKSPAVKENGVIVILFMLAIILLPFQNTGLQFTPLRFLGASLSFVPVLLLCAYGFVHRLTMHGSKKVELTLVALLFLSIIPTLWGMVFVNAGHISTSFLIKKTVTNTILNLLLLYPMFILPGLSGRLRLSIYTALALCLSGYVLVDVLNAPGMAYPSFFQASHAVTTPRGFSLEQSTFGATIALLCFLAAVVAQSKAMRVASILVLLIFGLIVTASKGTILCLILALGLTFVFSGRQRIIAKLLGLMFVALLGFLIADKVSQRFHGEFQKAGSVSTRAVLTLSTVPSLIHNPLGVGYSGYIPAIEKYVFPTADWLRAHGLNSASTDEIRSYIDSEDKRALNIKAQIFEYIMVYGIPGLVLVIVFHMYLFRRLYASRQPNRLYLLMLFWFALLSLLTYMPALGMYAYTMAYAVLIHAAGQVTLETKKDRAGKLKHPSFAIQASPEGTKNDEG